jgi:hypothetical protein
MLDVRNSTEFAEGARSPVKMLTAKKAIAGVCAWLGSADANVRPLPHQPSSEPASSPDVFPQSGGRAVREPVNWSPADPADQQEASVAFPDRPRDPRFDPKDPQYLERSSSLDEFLPLLVIAFLAFAVIAMVYPRTPTFDNDSGLSVLTVNPAPTPSTSPAVPTPNPTTEPRPTQAPQP